MKKRLLTFLMMFLMTSVVSWGQTTIWSESFETDGNGSRYSTSVSEFTDNGADYFKRTDGSDITGENFSNTQGSYYFGAQDTDGDGQPANLTLTFDNISISGYSNLAFKIFMAEDDASDSNQDWDANTYVHIKYDIDNSGTYKDLLWIEAEGGTNTTPKIDSDFDGIGDGTEITSTFSEFTTIISEVGSVIDILIEFNNLINGDEDIAFDNLSIIEGAAPTPSISVNTISLSGFNYEIDNGPSTSQSFTVSGSDLTNDISISPSTNYELSTDNVTFQSTAITLTQSGGTVAVTTIYARLKAGLSSASYNEDITISSTGATSKTVSCSGTVNAPISSSVIINEVDADTYSTDYDEFIELYDGGTGNTDLTGLVVVLFNGGTDLSYNAIDLDGVSTNANGYYVIGSAQVPNVDKVAFTNDGIQNGADAVALYQGDASSFPTGTAVTTLNLIDAIVYDTDDADDSGLLVLLNASEPQINENANSAKDYQSLQRVTNGSGGQRNTSTYALAAPTPGEKNFDEIWDGNTDGNWATADNWLNGVPSTSAKVYIPSGLTNYPEVSSAATVGDVTFEHNAQINKQENLTVSGTVTINHQITESTSALALDHWQYFTSPFTGLTGGNLLSTNARVDLYLAGYNNTLSATLDDAWAFISDSTAQLPPGTGYAVTFVDDGTETGTDVGTDYNMKLSGTLINASTNASVALTQGLNNWNLIGNPYLAPINWFDTNLDLTNIQGSLAYVYNPATSSYIAITSNGSGSGTVSPDGSALIPPMQGFFVEASSAGTFDLDLDARVNTTQGFYKSETISPLLRIQVQCDSLFDETALIMNEMAEQGFDAMDAHKLFANGLSPQIYTSTPDGHQLVFNQTNSLENDIILQVQTKKAGKHTLQLNEISGDFNNYRIYLTGQDNLNTELTDTEFSFNAEEGTNTYLFQLSFQNRTSNPIFDWQKTKVYAFGKDIMVKSTDELNGEINIFNLSGQKICRSTLNGKKTVINLQNETGIVLVQLISNGQITHHKVCIR